MQNKEGKTSTSIEYKQQYQNPDKKYSGKITTAMVSFGDSQGRPIDGVILEHAPTRPRSTSDPTKLVATEIVTVSLSNPPPLENCLATTGGCNWME